MKTKKPNHYGLQQTLENRDRQLLRLLDTVKDRVDSKLADITEEPDLYTLRPAWLERLSKFIASEQERIDREAANSIRYDLEGF